MDASSKLPEVTDFLSVQQFLTELYNTRKLQEPSFSYHHWSKELGITSRSFLRQIVLGRRKITESLRQVLLEKIPMDEFQKQYFSHLVWKDQAKDTATRTVHETAMMNLLKIKFGRFEVKNQLDFLSSPEMASLQVLLSYKDIDKTAQNLAHILNVEPQQIEKWLIKLEEIKMAEKHVTDGKITWQTPYQSFHVPDKPSDESIRYYHAESLKKAIQSISLPYEERKFRSLLCPMNEEQFRLISEKLNDFAMSLLKQFEGQEFGDKRIYQINLNLIPVTKPQKSTAAPGSPNNLLDSPDQC